jgi:hypothetical protein
MARTSLAERMNRLEQQRAKLAEQEAKLKADERKQRTRRLVEAGTLVEKAGLLELEGAALYGALLFLGRVAGDKAKITEWTKTGKTALDGETADGAAGEPLTVTFPAPLPTPFSTRLRGAGLRWNKLLQHWEGLAHYDAVAELAAEHEGTIVRVRADDGAGRKSAGSKPADAPSRS